MRSLLALFVRALRQSTRAGSTYWMRGGIALMVLLLLWTTHSRMSWAGAAGLRFFSSLMGFNYLIVTLMGLGLFCSAIAEEKEEKTLGLMRMADLTPLAIVLGKSTSQLGIVLLLLLTQIPFALLAVTMGGVGTTHVAMSFARLVAYLFALANISLFFSVVMPSSSRAARMTISLLLGYTLVCAGLFMIPEWLVFRKNYPLTDPTVVELKSVATSLWSVHPVSHWWTLSKGGYVFPETVARSIVVHLGVGLIFFLLSLLFFERCCGSETAYAGKNGKPKSRWFRRPRRTWKTPIAWKDFHFTMGGRGSIIGRSVGYGIVAAVIAIAASQSKLDDMVVNTIWGFGLLMLHAELVVLALLLWGPEAWGQHVGTLVATPMSLLQIGKQKLQATALAVIPSLLLILLALIIGGSSFLRELVEPFTVGHPLGGGFSSRHLNMIQLANWIVQFGVLLSLIVNLSLRLRWTALPAAFGVFLLLKLVTGMGLNPLYSITRPVPGYVINAIVNVFTALGLLYLINRNTHTLLLRRAAEG